MVYKKTSRKLVSRAKFARDTGVSPSAITKLCKVLPKAALVGKKIDSNHQLCIDYAEKQAVPKQIQPATGVDERYEEALKYCIETSRDSIRHIANKLNISNRRAEKISKLIKATGLVPSKKANIKPIPPGKKKERAKNGYTSKNDKKKADALKAAALKESQQEVENGEEILSVPEDIESFLDMTLREVIERFGSDAAFVDWLKATKSIEDINEKRLKNAKTKNQLVSRELIDIGIIEPVEEAHIKLLSDGARIITRRAITLHESGLPFEDIEIKVAQKITEFIRPIKTKVKRTMNSVKLEELK